VTIEIPADTSEEMADHILEKVDLIGLPDSIKKHTEARISRNGIPETRTRVEL
jgi:hypothetical protein